MISSSSRSIARFCQINVNQEVRSRFQEFTKICKCNKSEVAHIETYDYVIGKRQDRYDDDDDDDNIDYGGDKFTTYSLASMQSKRSKNMYFGGKKYYSKKYQNVTDIATRRKIFT